MNFSATLVSGNQLRYLHRRVCQNNNEIWENLYQVEMDVDKSRE